MAVIGAGLVGCLVARALAARGFQVNLYDGRPDPRDIEYEASCALPSSYCFAPSPHAQRADRSINLALSARGIKALRSIDEAMAERLLSVSVPVKARMIHFLDGGEDSQLYGLHGEVRAPLLA